MVIKESRTACRSKLERRFQAQDTSFTLQRCILRKRRGGPRQNIEEALHLILSVSDCQECRFGSLAWQASEGGDGKLNFRLTLSKRNKVVDEQRKTH